MNVGHGRIRARRGVLGGAWLCAAFCVALCGAGRAAPEAAPKAVPLATLIVGGGPSPRMNQVAIESNVRYVGSLLPAGGDTTVLFADGPGGSASVVYLDAPVSLPPGEAAFRFLWGEPPVIQPERLRTPRLSAIRGPADKNALRGAIDALAAQPDRTTLLYFTGHGERSPDRNLENNVFDLWGETTWSVREMADGLRKLPAQRPVVLVMVQCFSGAFANILFENADPQGAVLDRDLCGFFATVKERVAAGCTPEVNEAEYHDFTSYFFAALSGRDRLGRTVAPPDYDKNGRVGMDEAFAYALVEEPSIDIPVATSDAFLRRFATLSDDDLRQATYASVLAAASPAQRHGLEGLSQTLNATGSDRLQKAQTEVQARFGPDGAATGGAPLPGDLRRLRRRGRDTLIARFPDLNRARASEAFRAARDAAIRDLALHPEEIAPLLEASKQIEALNREQYAEEIRSARWLRFLRVARSVLLEQRLRHGGDKALIARFDRLRAAEARNPLRPEP